MGYTKEIIAKLKLDSKEFSSKLDEGTKAAVKFSAVFTGVSAAVLAATKFTANYRDETVKAARAAGATAEDFSALRHAADLSGLTIEQLTKGLQKLSNPAGQAREQLSRLGVSMTDASGKMKSQNQLLLDTADAFKKLETPAAKSSAALKIFGEEGARMVNLLSRGSDGLQQMTDEAARMGLVFDDEAGAAAELFNDNITRLEGSVRGCVQQITGGIIEFVNMTGIMETLSEVVQSVTGWWMRLDGETRKIIITIGAVVSGIAALALGIAGLIAIAPIMGAAITTMTGGLNLVVVGVAAAIAAFAAIAYGAVKYWDQVKTAMDPAVDTIQWFGTILADAFQPFVSAARSIADAIGPTLGTIIDKIKDWAGYTGEVSGKISVLGTIAKTVFSAISLAIVLTLEPLRLLVDGISGAARSFMMLLEGLADMSAGYTSSAVDNFKSAWGELKNTGNLMMTDLRAMGDKIKSSFSNLVVTIDTKQAKESIDKIRNGLKDLDGQVESSASIAGKLIGKLAGDLSSYVGKFAEGFAALGKDVVGAIQNIAANLNLLADEAASMGEKVSAVFGIIGKTAAAVMATVTDAIVAPIRAGVERMNLYMDVIAGRYTQAMEARIRATGEMEDERIAALAAKYDEEIALLEESERRKNAAIEFASNERMLMLDNEYQAMREKQELEFAAQMEKAAADYEIEKEFLLLKATDKEQRAITEEIMDQDFKLYMENQQAMHQQKLNQLAADFSVKQKAETESLKNAKVTAEKSTKDQITALTEQKNTEIEKREEEKNKKLEALEKKKQATEKLLKKAQLLMNWKAEVAEFQQTKGVKITQTLITGIAGAAQAFAMAAGSIPIVGLILGAVLMAAVMAMTAASVAMIATQNPPPAPAALFLQSGGVLSGPSHAAGGVPATLEGGEAVIDRARTERLINAVDRGMASAGGVQIVFEPGSIVNQGESLTESFIDQVSYAITRRLERQGVYA